MLDLRFHLYFIPGYRLANSKFGVVPKLALTSVKVTGVDFKFDSVSNYRTDPKCTVTYLGCCVILLVDGCMHWRMDFLTTYTHHSELQVITEPPLISTIHRSPQHPLSLFSLH
jgi:hypothetical protein